MGEFRGLVAPQAVPKPENTTSFNSKIRPLILHDSVTRDVIMIDENKLNLVIRDFVENRSALKDGFGYFGILLTLITTLITADFKDVGLSASVWQSVFILCTLWAASKLAQCAYKYFTTKTRTVDDLVEKIKKDSLAHSQASLTMSQYQ